MKVLVADPIADEGIEFLRKHAEVEVKPGLAQPELVRIIGDYKALVVRSQTRVTADVIEAAQKLVIIARAGVGADNIDVEAATRRGILVVNSPLGNIVSTAEHTIAMMLASARHITQANNLLRSGVWKREGFTGTEVRNKTLGVIGLGRVGSEVTRLARGLRMNVIAYDPAVSPDHGSRLGARLVTLEELLRQSDFITVHVPLTLATKGLIGIRELSMVKPSVRIINCARGGIVDENALFQALEEGRVAGAAIDVFSEEPARDSILFRSDKVVVTPHLAASTDEAQASVALDVCEQVVAVLAGHPPRSPVNAPSIPAETMSALSPYLDVGSALGKLAIQLAEGQPSSLTIRYEGDIANYETAPIRAAILGGLLESLSEERVNIVNANIVAASRGLKVSERKETVCENYANLLTVELQAAGGSTLVAGTAMRGESHIVRVDDYWIDIVPAGGYLLLTSHRDRPGMVGAVGTIVGSAGVNISHMQVGRLDPGGKAMMALCLDGPLPPEYHRQVLALPDMYRARVVKL
jgi:D-3-phosphoglycerate dehydrogenase